MRRVLRRAGQVGAFVLAAALTAMLWPAIPAEGEADLASQRASAQVEAAEVQVPGALQAQADGADESAETDPDPSEGRDEGDAGETGDPGDGVSDEERLELDMAADAKAFEEISEALSQQSFAYRSPVSLSSIELPEGDELPSLRLAYSFSVDEDASTSKLSASFAGDDDLSTLSILPVDVSEAAEELVITAQCQEAPEFAPQIRVRANGIGRKQISVADEVKLPFRLDEAQQASCAKGAYEQAIKACTDIWPQDLEGTRSPLGAFGLTSYPVDEHGFSAQVELSLCDQLSRLYALDDAPRSVCVDPVKDVGIPAYLSLDGVSHMGAWTNAEQVRALYGGHSLALSLDDDFAPTVPLNGAEGWYEGVQLYAKDQSGVITKVSGISYGVDRTAPVIDSFCVEGAGKNIWDPAFWIYRGKAKVTISISDAPGKLDAVRTSGLTGSGAHVEYMDSHVGEAKRIDAPGLVDDGGRITFYIDEDQVADVSSFKVHVRDMAGNALSSDLSDSAKIPDGVMRIMANSGAPSISVEHDNHDVRNGHYFSAARNTKFIITEPNFQYVQQYDPDQQVVTIHEDGAVRVLFAKDFQHVSGDVWSAGYSFAQDADYEVQMRVRDLSGDESELYQESFTVDRTAPGLEVSFDGGAPETGAYCNRPMTASITVRDRNFTPDGIHVDASSEEDADGRVTAAEISEWAEDGDAWVCFAEFAGPGIYGLAVSGEDLAGNEMVPYSLSEFTVDAEAPEITVTVGGDDDASARAYPGDCSLSVKVHDANLDPASSITVTPIGLGSSADAYSDVADADATEMTLTQASPAEVPENDNVYRLEVSAADLAGNEASKIVEWSVNRFGSTYLLDSDTQELLNKKYVKASDLPDIRITEINPSGLIDGGQAVSVTNGVRTSTLTRDEDYSLQAAEDESWPAYEYVISKERFASDGTYQVSLSSTDHAGNASMNIMEGKNADRSGAADIAFAVDSTPPLVSFNGFQDPQVASAEHEVSFLVQDNGQLDHADIAVNGQMIKSMSAGELAAPGGDRITLKEGPDAQMVSVKAYDAAGNERSEASPAIHVGRQGADGVSALVGIALLVLAGALLISAGAIFAVRFRKEKAAGVHVRR